MSTHVSADRKMCLVLITATESSSVDFGFVAAASGLGAVCPIFYRVTTEYARCSERTANRLFGSRVILDRCLYSEHNF